MGVDLNAVSSDIADELPKNVVWGLNSGEVPPINYDFTPQLQPVPDDIFGHEEEWNELLIFGEYSIDGGANVWLCINTVTGIVYGLDPEREGEAIFLLNSSLEQFIATFRTLNDFLDGGEPVPPDIETTLRAIDSEMYNESEWGHFVHHVLNIQNGR